MKVVFHISLGYSIDDVERAPASGLEEEGRSTISPLLDEGFEGF